jgi:hypothetical protein
MQFVLMVYQGTTPLPGSDRWQVLSEAEQKAIYAAYAELNKTTGVAPGLPLGLCRTPRERCRCGTTCTSPANSATAARAAKPRPRVRFIDPFSCLHR